MCKDFYRSQLISSQALLFYDTLQWQIVRGNTSGSYTLPISARKNALRDGFAAIQAVYYDHPEWFFLSAKNEIKVYEKKMILHNAPKYTSQHISRIRIQLERVLQQLCEGVQGLPQWERERMVYERLAKKLKYQKHSKAFDYDIVGPILQSNGVCEGFTCLFTLAMRRIKIPCIRVNGESDREGHCWNLVWIDGIPAHVDLTWDAIQCEQEAGYFWFNLMDAEIQRDHKITTEGLPVCNSPQLGYHFRTNSLFSSMDSAVVTLNQRLWKGSMPLHVKLLGNINIERCLQKAIQQAPPANYRYTYVDAQHAGIIIRNTQ